jgi:hypothetical protein
MLIVNTQEFICDSDRTLNELRTQELRGRAPRALLNSESPCSETTSPPMFFGFLLVG